MQASSWLANNYWLHGTSVFVASVLISLQAWIALHNGEAFVGLFASGTICRHKHKDKNMHQGQGVVRHYVRVCTRAKEQWLSAAVVAFLTVVLAWQLNAVATASPGYSCLTSDLKMRLPLADAAARVNNNLMKSWTVLSIVMWSIIMILILIPGVKWLLRGEYATAEAKNEGGGGLGADFSKYNLRAVQKVQMVRSGAQRFVTCLAEVDQAFDDLFSFEKGRYYLYLRLVAEVVEVVTQTSQILLFAHEKPLSWVSTLSTVLILNGLLMPAPFMLGALMPSCSYNETKLILAAVDATFDAIYLLIAVIFSEHETFGRETWLYSTLGVIIPLVGIALVARDISEAARNTVMSAQWRKDFGTSRPRRRSKMLAAIRSTSSPGVKQKRRGQTDEDGGLVTSGDHIHRGGFFLVGSAAVVCVVVGGYFLNMAFTGDAVCRQILGEDVWEGSEPKHTIFKTDGVLQMGCNLTSIRSIEITRRDADVPMLRLPLALTRLAALERLVVSGHDIASNGVPAGVFDEMVLPKLTKLEFGGKNPVNQVLDLSRDASRFEVFPGHVLRYMTELETLRLDGAPNISCFPPLGEFSRLQKLRKLNLSGSSISYLPPSILIDHPGLHIILSQTPVSRSLEWGRHGLGQLLMQSERSFWDRLASTLPMLISLNISGNALQDFDILPIAGLRKLRRLDLSHNPELFFDSESWWWDAFSAHPGLNNADFIGLANVGLGPSHIALQRTNFTRSFSCSELRWIRKMTKPIQATSHRRLDLDGNGKFQTFVRWHNVVRSEREGERQRENMMCRCEFGRDCLYVDEAIYYLILCLLPNVDVFSAGFVFQPNFFELVSADKTDEVSLRPSFAGLLEAMASHEVIQLRIHSFLSTRIPPEIGYLKDLAVLDLSKNLLSGEIPQQISRLQSLDYLRLDENNFSGRIPESLSQLSGLSYLNLENNKFVGPIPANLSALGQLAEMRISRSDVSGEIPRGLSALKKLTLLNLNFNEQLAGPIPVEFSAMTNLAELSLEGNKLDGVIPSGIGALQSLTRLWLSNNKFSGTMPASVGNLTKLEQLGLSSNNFLPSPLPGWIGALTKLGKLEIARTNLYGSLPLNSSMSNLTKLKMLDVHENHLTGTISDDISTLTNLETVLLQENNFRGEIPQSLSALTNLVKISLSSNKLTGHIPNSLSELTKLEVLELKDNDLTGPMPTLSSLPKLTSLLVDGNHLTQPLPNNISNLCLVSPGSSEYKLCK